MENKTKRLAKQTVITTAKLRKIIVEALLDKKGNEVVTLDLRKLSDRPTDFFIIAHGDSSTQVRALAENVIKETEDNGIKPFQREGAKGAEWIIIDFSDVVVHVFYREKRDFYQLEDLWQDAKRTHHHD